MAAHPTHAPVSSLWSSRTFVGARIIGTEPKTPLVRPSPADSTKGAASPEMVGAVRGPAQSISSGT